MNTTDFILYMILAVVLFFAGRSTWQRLSGTKTCCGTTKEKVPPKKLEGIIGTKTIHVKGMHCDNCRVSVTKALNALDGVSAKVVLSKKTAVVSYNRAVSDAELTEAIENKGFEVAGIEG